MDFSRFFIDRPIFAAVLSILIFITGLIAIPLLPVSEYPDVVPPSVQVRAEYPGANPKVIAETVATPLEEAINGVENMMYMKSVAGSDGVLVTTVTFRPGTDPDQAQVQVQNRVAQAEARLPEDVRRLGITTQKQSPTLTLVVHLFSPNGKYDSLYMRNYATLKVKDELARLPGVGQIQIFGSGEYAMRVWLDPNKVAARGLTASDVVTAMQEQNVQVSAGQLGAEPLPKESDFLISINAQGRLHTEDEFGNIVLKTTQDGTVVRLRDVARIEMGSGSYALRSQLNNKDAVGIGIFQSPGANAIDLSNAVRAKMDELSTRFPEDMKWAAPYDPTVFVRDSIRAVVQTLLEAVVLVVLVVILFLQTWRASIIPLIAVPVSVVGTFSILYLLGFSLNTLSLFGLVLAIGIVVDDAIVVVENVERIMAEEGLPPKEATRKAMGQISGAIVGITLVLVAVFLPMAFMQGSVGVIYQQFSLSMAVSILFSAFLALSLTPALCATLLKPVAKGEHHERKGFFGWFNRHFESMSNGYQRWVVQALKRSGRYLLVYAVLLAVLGYGFSQLPTAFLPTEDQGYTITDTQLPPGASRMRTEQVAAQIEAHNAEEPGVGNTTVILGFSFSGSGQNAALTFTTLKDWSERGADDSAQSIADRASAAFSQLKDAVAFSVLPPPIDGLGESTGFEFRLQDRGGMGHAELMAARDTLLANAGKSKVLTNVREASLAESPQVQLEIDRRQANALGVSFADIGSVLDVAVGSSYVNDFPNQGRMQRVVVQAEGDQRSQVEDLLKIHVRNNSGKMVPLGAFVQAKWVSGPVQLTRYNGYPAVSISGEPAAGHSSGEAMAEIERLVAQLPPGAGLEWTGLSLQERLSGSQAPMLMALSLLIVFLCLAALYESWSIPTAVLLVVPLGILGAVLAVTLRGMPNDVFFKVGLITLIGLSAKNAILIIEFAKHLVDQGVDAADAAVQAARLRLRPIVMTSLAFILGVVPLAIASGASSASQQAIGTGVIGGMLSATLAVVFVPVFFVVVMRLAGRRQARDANAQVGISES